ncbi:MAG TPA: protein kinase [Gemmatimonadales bacterium]|jgi:serine/threonine-protein kinase|nr:protein kinase [Gemmatimonadales bacterium]
MPGSSATRPAFGLFAKIFLASALLVVVVLGITFGVTSFQANRTADESIGRALSNTRGAVGDFLAARTRAFAGMSAVSAEVPQFRERLLTSRDRQNVLDQAGEYRDLIGAAWVLVANRDGILLARTDYPEEYDIDVSRGALIAKALSGEQTSGAFIDDRDPAAVKLYMAVATPLAARGAAPQGVLVAAYALNDSLAHAIRQATNSDVVFFAVTSDSVPRAVVVGATLPAAEVDSALAGAMHLDSLGSDSVGTRMTAQLRGEHLIGLAGPIRSAGGDVFGGFLALRSREAELAAFQALRRTMLFAIVLGVLLALGAAAVAARRIAAPVRRLALATRKVQDGDYRVDIEVRSADEIGILSQAFKSLVEDLKEKAALVEYMMSASGAAATQPISSAPTAVRDGGGQLRPGTLFANRYDVKEILGAGGMGVVYRAFDRELQEAVAIKTLRPEAMAGESVALERFKQEIRLARRIAHRNVVRTYDLGEVGGVYYLTMEYVEGTSLKQLIASRGKLPVPVTLTIGKQLCRALEVAHAEGVIHRDVKPQNMVVEPSGFLKVMDFGIARLVNPPKGKGLTEAGVSIGTPDYMSPEQLSGSEVDARGDLYAAGVVLFECVTGRVPFEAETTWALVAKHLEEPVPDPRSLNGEVPAGLAGVILRAMAKSPADRYQSAAEMHDALAALG